VIEIPTDDPRVIRDLTSDGDNRSFLDSMHAESFDQEIDVDHNTIDDRV
jgi:hypothetical protein